MELASAMRHPIKMRPITIRILQMIMFTVMTSIYNFIKFICRLIHWSV
jgi:hypothetical protein